MGRSLIIDKLSEKFIKDESSLAYFYFDYSDPEAQSLVSVVGSLLRQFISQQSEIPSEIKDLYDRSSRTAQPLQLDDLLIHLKALCQDPRPRFVVLDALDEYEAGKPRQTMLDIIEQLEQLRVRLFITSRPHADGIKRILDTYPQIVIEAQASDIAQYITQRIEEDKDLEDIMDTQLKDEIIIELCRGADGM